MMTQPFGLVVFFIKVLVLIKSNVLVRSFCLQDVLAFYYDDNDFACNFTKDDFNSIFNGHTARCQLFDCSYVSNPDMTTDETYEIERIIIQFSQTDDIILDKPCGSFKNEDLYVTVNCEEINFQDRGIGESCFKDNQCAMVTVNSACNQTARVCQCKAGYLYLCETNSCFPEQNLGEACSDTRQCEQMNPYSMCSVENKCECIHGYTKLNNTCLPERRLNETCDDDIQCSVVTPNSTCNRTTNVCECTEGHLQMLNMCVHGLFLMNEISQHCTRLPSTIENVADKNMQHICNMYAAVFQSTSEEADNGSSYGLVIGVGIAGLVIGIAVCGVVYVIITQQRTKSQTRTNAVKEETNHPRSVQVSNAVYSNPIQYKDKRSNTGIAGENAIYNHLHEDPSDICIQTDYDHVPQLGTEDDDYSHLGTCNATDVDSPEEYGVVN
eukprot:XP_011431555.1 PREDICTED: uncharacterized protein LOC105331164 isoform X1 [Crassostrea gigas]